MGNIQIFTSGIKKSLQKYTPLKSLIEYVWNGFDAKATCVEVFCEENQMGGIVSISIRDNGYGIPKEELSNKFIPFFDSEKVYDPYEKRTISVVHGKNGVGRLTFFHFSTGAKWTTVYKMGLKKYTYDIFIKASALQKYEENDKYETDESTGTIVSFENIVGINSCDEIRQALIDEFCWFLELNKANGYEIKLNGTLLDYSGNISDYKTIDLKYEKTNKNFEVRYIQWERKLNGEYSRYYLINSNNNEVYKDTTTLNNKGDHFYHSIYIKSDIFDNFSFYSNEYEEQCPIVGYNKTSDEYKFLMKEVENFLRRMRKPFLKKFSDSLIDELEKVKAFPNYDTKNYFESLKKSELENVVRGIYQLQPKIFSNLNVEQKKTLVRFLDLIMDSGECENLLNILNDIIELDYEEREELSCLLHTTKMSNIVKTIKLIKDRYKAVEELKQLVFNKDLNANEVYHLQKFIEKHYWIFGEQYHLVTAAEPDFEEALRRYVYILTGESKKRKIVHEDKNKEMDIFAIKQDIDSNSFTNIVVELKHPDVKLGQKQLNQVKQYMNVILEQPEFNGNNMKWEFYLIGNDFDRSKSIENEFKSNKGHGEKSLAFKIDRYKIYVKKWSEVFADFEMKHKFLNEKLELEKNELLEKKFTANSIICNIDGNTAIQPSEFNVK